MEIVIPTSKVIPEKRRIKDNNTIGTLGEDGYFRTPNGSFWDPDEEYFNRHGYDIHGGSYSNIYDYVPGADWISELGCYPDEREKYEQGVNDDFDLEEEDAPEMKGDFEEEGDDDFGISLEDLKKLNINPDNKDANALLAKYGLLPETQTKLKPKKKKGKYQKKEDDEWESLDEDVN